MHPKCVVMDDEEVLVTSANFTEAAQQRNIEVGLLVRSQSVARQITQFFDGLISAGCCSPLRFLQFPCALPCGYSPGVCVLRSGTCGERRGLSTRSRQSAFEFLPPMRNIPGRPVTINHDHRPGACIRELMENFWRYIDSLSCSNFGPFLSEAHLTATFEDQINLFLLLVMPRHLSAVCVERYVSQ